MDAARRDRAVKESRKALALMHKRELTTGEQDAVVADCVRTFDQYVNPGILEYRKSMSTDYTAVEWRDEGNVFYDIRGREFIDCLGGFGIYMLGLRGLGLLIGVQFVSEAVGYAVATGLFGEGILTAGTLFSAETSRYEPPATLTQQPLDQIIERTERVLQRVREQLRDGELASV